MAVPFYLRLPFLHEGFQLKNSSSKAAAPGPLLSPGRQGVDGGFWTPRNLPFGPEKARKLLEELASLRIDDLEAMFHAHVESQNADLLAELAELNDFANGVPRSGEDEKMKIRLVMEQAQKTLLWIWLQEERILELGALVRRCGEFSGNIAASLREDGKMKSAFPEGAEVDDDMEWLLPPWRVCVINAAIFIAPQTPILAEGKMGDDIAEILDFTPYEPVSEYGAGEDAEFLAASAPLWKITGSSAPMASRTPFLNEIYNARRLWLIRR